MKHPRPDLAHHHLQRQDDVWLGKRRVDIRQLGRAHTAGDAVIHVPDANVMFTGDIVEAHSACYCGDGHFADWGTTLEAIRAFDLDAIAPGRGDAVIGRDAVNGALDRTKDFRRQHLHARRPRRRPERHLERGMGRLPRRMRPEVQGLRDLRALPALQRRPRL
jgi:glyoxylase-like metal-dependent hydrolase (beta-lactamase superfamily II)